MSRRKQLMFICQLRSKVLPNGIVVLQGKLGKVGVVITEKSEGEVGTHTHRLFLRQDPLSILQEGDE